MEVLNNFEKYLVFFCSPVLIGIKPSNLFSYPMGDWKEIKMLLTAWNKELLPLGKHIVPLTVNENRILLFVYDKALLDKQLNSSNMIEFLNKFSYPTNGNNTDKLLYLSKRLQRREQFPHEIGIFLGYPIDDVIAFITNKGQNYQCSGYWKVYYNQQETLQLFHKYTFFRNQLYKKLKEGMNITQIISLF